MSGKSRSIPYRSMIILLVTALVLVVFPLLLLLASYGIKGYILSHRLRILQVILGSLGLAYGFFMLIWTVVSQVRSGQGTPSPVAPTQKLIIDGPYLRRRNPMLLGVIIYFFGVGTLLDSIASGLIMASLGLILGTCYVKFVEERELRIRFGKEYEEYKNKTPFILCKF